MPLSTIHSEYIVNSRYTVHTKEFLSNHCLVIEFPMVESIITIIARDGLIFTSVLNLSVSK